MSIQVGSKSDRMPHPCHAPGPHFTVAYCILKQPQSLPSNAYGRFTLRHFGLGFCNVAGCSLMHSLAPFKVMTVWEVTPLKANNAWGRFSYSDGLLASGQQRLG